MIEIKCRWTAKVLYKSDKAATVKEALLEAVNERADLRSADLSGAYLSGASLSGADLRSADLRSADLRSAYLRSAYLSGADLRSADLSGAYLSGAYLSGAYLSGAYLSGADLRSADLSGAYLSGAKGLNAAAVQPLLMLLDQPGKQRAYKLVTADLENPIHRSGRTIQYTIGAKLSVDDADTDPIVECGAGINVATLDWCIKNWKEGWRILIVEFTANDIAAIPTAGDGKFRLHRCKVVAEKSLEECGLPWPKKETAAI